KVQALKQHKKGLMQQLFPAEGETTPRLRFPEFREAGAWEVQTIDQLASKIAQGGTPKTSIPKYWNGDIPWITPAEMGEDAAHHYAETTHRTISREGFENSSTELLPVNSVIISSRAPIGYVTINKIEMATNQGCKGIVPKKNTYHEFFYFSLIVAKQRLNDLGAGAGFKEISTSTLKAFQISIPKHIEQQKIAHCLSSLDEVIGLESHKLDALKNLKKGLMQQLFPQEVA
ncbi:restriction endonuclease subunit S, partial [Thiolapillus sp.]|uniref:restriction endonuclease subunit S n=3 Tax=Thiolapillus sp. TaxID=2017437 RepID=UPI0025D18854